jgi:hypothetical protein
MIEAVRTKSRRYDIAIAVKDGKGISFFEYHGAIIDQGIRYGNIKHIFC